MLTGSLYTGVQRLRKSSLQDVCVLTEFISYDHSLFTEVKATFLFIFECNYICVDAWLSPFQRKEMFTLDGNLTVSLVSRSIPIGDPVSNQDFRIAFIVE